MQIEKRLISDEPLEEECVVVIDVLRAFTTTAYAFAAGAARILPIHTREEGLALKERDPSLLLMGERHGERIAGFDFGNSPWELQQQILSGRTLALRSSSGIKGLLYSQHSQHILPASFVVAEATYQRLLKIQPSKVTFLITGKGAADEDWALADYLEAKLTLKEPVDAAPFLERVSHSSLGQKFKTLSSFSKDLQAALELDRFPFTMHVEKTPSGILIKKT